jgi:hypothetical protein
VIDVQVGRSLGLDLPSVGVGMAGHGERLSERETELITALRPGHLRADLQLDTDEWQAALDRAADASRSTATGLELALFLGAHPEAELEALASALPLAQARIVRVLLFRDDRPVVDPGLVRLVKDALVDCAPGAPFAGGPAARLATPDRVPLSREDLDAVVCSISSAEPAGDSVWAMEKASAHGDAVRAAQAVCPGVPAVVGPVTSVPGERHSSIPGAAWTLASLASLAHAGASSVSYFETTGPAGVMERDGGSRPGAVFPVYHVLADIQEWEYGQVGESRSSASVDVAVLCAHTLDGPRILLANLTSEPRRCTVGPLSAAQVAVRVLDESSVDSACDDPARFRGRYAKRRTREGALELELAPFAFVRLNA